MTDATRGAFRHGLAVCLTALVVGSLHVPQPFLAILAAQLVAGIPCPTASVFFSRLASAASGSLCGIAILTLAPNEQWVSLPLFFVLAGWGTSFVAKHRDPASAILFCMGIASMVAEGFVFPARDLPFGLAHTASLITASICSAVAGRIFPFPKIHHPVPKHLETPLAIGLAAVAALIVACSVLPTQPTVTVVAAVTTAFSLGGGLGVVGQKFLGGLLGASAAVAFVIILSGAGNDVAIYLLGLVAVMAGFEGMAVRFPKNSAALRQAGAIFAVMGTILPAPQQFLWGSVERMCAVLAGLLIGCGVAWGVSLTASLNSQTPVDSNPGKKSADQPATSQGRESGPAGV
jgi:hypothetical protein